VLSNIVMDDPDLYCVFCQMQGGGGECESTRTGPVTEQCCQTYQWMILIHTVYFCQMQGGGGECESTGTGPDAEQCCQTY
jgi:hypothetical protein